MNPGRNPDSGYNQIIARLPGENYVFLCPGMSLAAMRTIQFVTFDFSFGPQIFPDCLPARREFRRRRAPD
jgi:hypothetical protein